MAVLAAEYTSKGINMIINWLLELATVCVMAADYRVWRDDCDEMTMPLWRDDRVTKWLASLPTCCVVQVLRNVIKHALFLKTYDARHY